MPTSPQVNSSKCHAGKQYEEKAEKKKLPMKWNITNKEDSAFKKLGFGRIDLLPTEEISGWGKCRQFEIIDKVDTAKKFIYRKPYYLGLSMNSAVNKGLMSKINTAISEMKTDVTLVERLIAKLKDDARK